MTYNYRTSGVCSRQMELSIDDDGIISGLKIDGGCSGNSQGLELLVVGRPAEEVGDMLRGVRCGEKSTSCPDQLSRAIDEALKIKGRH